MMVHELRERLRSLNPDILFYKKFKVCTWDMPRAIKTGRPGHSTIFWPKMSGPHRPMVATWFMTTAIMAMQSSRVFPSSIRTIRTSLTFVLKRRGLLHCRIELPEGPAAHCVCVHLSLFGYSRRKQMTALADHIEQMAEPNSPLIIAGDFNDWSNSAGLQLTRRLSLSEVFSNRDGSPACSFPAARPMFRLDRIYVRGFDVKQTEVHHGLPWSAISDHAALSAHLARHGG
jgi:endonuclease/exonuclease/phosphatase family metal-dependent hydrolase